MTIGGMGRSFGLLGRVPGGGWKYPGASIDIDSAGNRASPPTVATQTAITRATAAMTEDISRTWASTLSSVLRRTNAGAGVDVASANGVRNNSMQGVAVGAPGTLPTNWQKSS